MPSFFSLSPRITLPLVLTALPGAACAAEATPGLSEGLGQMLLGLMIVLGLLLGTLWLIKRLSTPHGSAAGLRVLGAVPVGPRERVVLVEVAGQVLILGVTQASVRTLHTLPAEALKDLQTTPPGTAPMGDFAGWLKRSMERRNDGQ